MAAEGVGALAEKLPTLASYSESDGVARRGSGFASGLDVCCHFTAMPPAACSSGWLPQRTTGGKRRLCFAVLAVKDEMSDVEDPETARSNAEGGVMYICRRLRVPGNSTTRVQCI